MTTEEQISAIQTERDDARQDLRDTLSQVNDKVDHTEDEMRPDHVIESHTGRRRADRRSVGLSVWLDRQQPRRGPIVIAGLLGVAISKHGSDDDS